MSTTRDLAIVTWSILLLVWAVSRPGAAKFVRRLLRPLLAPKPMRACGALFAYTALVVVLLALVHLWTPASLKETAAWFLLTGASVAFSAARAVRGRGAGQPVLRDQVVIVVMVEFFAARSTFPLWIEMLLVPGLALLGLLDVVARSKPEYALEARVTAAVQVIVGLAVIGFGVQQTALPGYAPSILATLDPIALVPLLSLSLVPFMYLFSMLSANKQPLLGLQFGPRKDAAGRTGIIR